MLSHSTGKLKSKGNWILNAVGCSSKSHVTCLLRVGFIDPSDTFHEVSCQHLCSQNYCSNVCLLCFIRLASCCL